jgi:hypothetical protein
MRASGSQQTSEQPRGFGGIGLMAALNFGDTTCAAREA